MVLSLLRVLVAPARPAGQHARNLRLNRDRGPADRAGPCQCSGAAHPGRWSQKAEAFKQGEHGGEQRLGSAWVSGAGCHRLRQERL